MVVLGNNSEDEFKSNENGRIERLLGDCFLENLLNKDFVIFAESVTNEWLGLKRDALIGDVMLVYYVITRNRSSDFEMFSCDELKSFFIQNYANCDVRKQKDWKNQTVSLNDALFKSVYGVNEIAELNRMVIDIEFICYLKFFNVCFFSYTYHKREYQ